MLGRWRGTEEQQKDEEFALSIYYNPRMGRPWEYPRWRRMLMQVLMWLILGGTIGLAQLVTYHRSHAPIALSPPVQVGPFLVRVPDGWSVEARGPKLDAEDDAGRHLLVLALPITAASDDGVDVDAGGQGRGGSETMEFRGLHQTGTMQILSRIRRTAEGAVRTQVLTGTAVVPKIGVIVLELYPAGPRPGSADRRLLQSIADGISQARGGASAAVFEDPNLPHLTATDPNAACEPQWRGHNLVVTVTTPNRTGGLRISPRGAWPAAIVVRLDGVNRLEKLRARNGRVSLHLSSESDEPPTLWRIREGKDVDPLPFEQRFSAQVREEEDAVQITLPAALYTGDAKELTVEWSATSEPESST